MAHRIRDLTAPTDRICELGAGLGFVAFYLNRMDRLDTTLFDIPIANVFSAFFLIGALGDAAVSLEGESSQVNSIKIRANWNCINVPDKYFRITANQDSFPEINRNIFQKYICEIERNTVDFLLSINHEIGQKIDIDIDHLNVSNMLRSNRQLKVIYRSPYWVRKGYVEELYKII